MGRRRSPRPVRRRRNTPALAGQAPSPEEIYERTRAEGRRRLSRPLLELAATALVGGFDIAFGVGALGLASGAVMTRFGSGVGHLAGAIAFGLGFVFVVVGRSELFTENFLVPVTGLSRQRGSWLKLGELWVATLVLNLVGGVVIALLLTSRGVLRRGASHALTDVADHLAAYGPATAFLSAIAAGALMTLMTWFVEGAAESHGVRIVMAWLVGALIAFGAFNHAIVSTVELVFGMRYGADIGVDQLFANLGLSIAGNLIGGLLLVTFARSAQAFGASR
jgi:formate/nitrite transporter FocA (FNT family)